MDILELQTKLDNQSAWRKKELLQAHFLAENAQNEEAQRYLCRAWVLMMYAHCDNFLKEAARLYIDYIKINPHPDYKPELLWLMIRGQTNATEAADKNYKTPLDYYKSKAILYEAALGKEIFEKRSFKYRSLRFFCDWVLQIKYDHSSIRAFCRSLEEKRNAIAHGEEAYIEKIDDCLQWHQTTIQFIDTFRDSLIEAARGIVKPKSKTKPRPKSKPKPKKSA